MSSGSADFHTTEPSARDRAKQPCFSPQPILSSNAVAGSSYKGRLIAELWETAQGDRVEFVLAPLVGASPLDAIAAAKPHLQRFLVALQKNA